MAYNYANPNYDRKNYTHPIYGDVPVLADKEQKYLDWLQVYIDNGNKLSRQMEKRGTDFSVPNYSGLGSMSLNVQKAINRGELAQKEYDKRYGAYESAVEKYWKTVKAYDQQMASGLAESQQQQANYQVPSISYPTPEMPKGKAPQPKPPMPQQVKPLVETAPKEPEVQTSPQQRAVGKPTTEKQAKKTARRGTSSLSTKRAVNTGSPSSSSSSLNIPR